MKNLVIGNHIDVIIKKYGNNAGTVSAEKNKAILFVNGYYTLYESKYASVLIAIFVTEIINNFAGKSIAFADYIFFFEIFFMFRHAFVEKLEQRINSSLFKSLAFYKFNIYKD